MNLDDYFAKDVDAIRLAVSGEASRLTLTEIETTIGMIDEELARLARLSPSTLFGVAIGEEIVDNLSAARDCWRQELDARAGWRENRVPSTRGGLTSEYTRTVGATRWRVYHDGNGWTAEADGSPTFIEASPFAAMGIVDSSRIRELEHTSAG